MGWTVKYGIGFSILSSYKLKPVIYIDYLGKYIMPGESKLSKAKNKKAAYTKAYNKYFKKGVLVLKIKKQKL